MNVVLFYDYYWGQNNAEFAMKLRILYIINFIIDLTPKCRTKFDETQTKLFFWCLGNMYLMYHIMSWLLMTL